LSDRSASVGPASSTTDRPGDTLALGQRVVAVLETGLCAATHKLATLMSLVFHCVEHLPGDPHAELAVPIRGLTYG